MAYTYKWELTGLKKQNTENLSDVICNTYWKVTATDENGLEASFTGATPFKVSDVDVNNFTSYSSLSEEQVLTWIKNVVSGSAPSNYWAHIKERIDVEINRQKYNRTDVSMSDFPWSPTSGSIAAPSGSAPL
jgi:hypothetical protein